MKANQTRSKEIQSESPWILRKLGIDFGPASKTSIHDRKKSMKTIKVTAMVTILVASLVFATTSPAEARKVTNDDKLSPKSYEIKIQKITTEKSNQDNSNQKKSFGKAEQIKTKLKQMEAKKALEFVKKTYKT
ncbi:MAG: hypothetical protein QXW37_06145 [Candidatus Nitrosotenuis sp.]